MNSFSQLWIPAGPGPQVSISQNRTEFPGIGQYDEVNTETEGEVLTHGCRKLLEGVCLNGKN